MFTKKGIGVSSGIAIGRAYLLDRKRLAVSRVEITDEQIKDEIERFKRALATSKDQLEDVKQRHYSDILREHSYILDSHILILEDKTLVNGTAQAIRDLKINAEWAVKGVIADFVRLFDEIEDEYIRERKLDIEHVGERILKNLMGQRMDGVVELPPDAVVVAHDLAPSDTLQLKKDRVVGFATDIGSRTSHTAIMANSIGISAVVGLEDVTERVDNGDLIIVDGSQGIVIVNPDGATLLEYRQRQQKHLGLLEELQKIKGLPAITIDGHSVELVANIETPDEIEQVIDKGARGVGLYRTEFLFMGRPDLPTEDEHFRAYKEIVEKVAPHAAVIRTLDVGGDKISSALDLGDEINPALGLRAIRFCLKHQDIFETQFRGILRASAFGKLKILLPMISGVQELRKAKQMLRDAMDRLRQENIPFDESIEVGVMIEIPSAALTADILAKECDFFSIGTNDLIQYALAIDRSNEHVAYLYEPLHPAVLRVLSSVVKAAHNHNIPVAMCGEMAGEPLYSVVLTGLGFDNLSMNPAFINRVKRIIRSTTLTEARQLAEEILSCSTTDEATHYVERYMTRRFPDEVGAG
ncbi:MAG: phosphoenolpyruvate--protein phosphotransferase [Nitrospirota bacterium]|nr:phosphoenolpyruvate--protein phosphotransferase [Nitrospirota bacterium]